MRKIFVRTSLAFAGLLTVTMALSAAAPVTVQVPFSFTASGKKLPAGEYRIEALGSGAIRIAGEQPNSTVLALVTSDPLANTSATVTFDSSGTTPRLSSVKTSSGTWQILAAGGSKAFGLPPAVSLRTK